MQRHGPRRANSGISSGPPTLIGTGDGGLEELRDYLEDSAVLWALLRWEIGSGTFVRSKLIAVHFNGDGVPVVRRGKLNSRTAEVLKNFGEVHATVEVKRKEDFSVDFVCERLLPLLTADAGMEKSLSAEALRKDYEALMAQKQKAGRSSQRSKGPRTAIERGSRISASQALKAVGDASGPYNWLLMEPDQLELHNAGYGGMSELKKWLAEDMVLFGVIRFMFGLKTSTSPDGIASARGLVKYVFIHWVGPEVSALKRGKWNAQQKQADAKVRRVCSITFRKEAHGQDDLQLTDLISELRRLAVVEGAAASVQKQEISVEEYEAALALEQQAQMEIEAEDVAKAELPDMKEAITSVRHAGGNLNWCLLGTQAPASQAAPAEASRSVTTSAAIPDLGGPPASPRKSLSPRPGFEPETKRKSLSPMPRKGYDEPCVSRPLAEQSLASSLSPLPAEQEARHKSLLHTPLLKHDLPTGNKPVDEHNVPGESLSPRPAEQNDQFSKLPSRLSTEAYSQFQSSPPSTLAEQDISRTSLPACPPAIQKGALGLAQEGHHEIPTSTQQGMSHSSLSAKPAGEQNVPHGPLQSEPSREKASRSTALAVEWNSLPPMSPRPEVGEKSLRNSLPPEPAMQSDMKQRLSHTQGCQVSFSSLSTTTPHSSPAKSEAGQRLHRQNRQRSTTSIHSTNTSESLIQKAESFALTPSTKDCKDLRLGSSGSPIAATSERSVPESKGESTELPPGSNEAAHKDQATDNIQQLLSHHQGYHQSVSKFSTTSAGDGVDMQSEASIPGAGQREGVPSLSGRLHMKAGWGWWWARRHFELKQGRLRWWRKLEDWRQRTLPTGEIRLADGDKQWVLWHYEGTSVELRCHQRINGSTTDGMTAVGDRIVLRADVKQAAQDWAQALQQHISYVEMLMAWPMPPEGRQGDIRYYGIDYPAAVLASSDLTT